MKNLSISLCLTLLCYSLNANSQHDGFDDTLRAMSPQERKLLTVQDYKDGIYEEIKSRLKRGERIEVIVEYGGAVIKPGDLANQGNYDKKIIDDKKAHPSSYREYKSQILKSLPADSVKVVKEKNGAKAVMLLRVNEESIDSLYKNPLVTAFYINEFISHQDVF